MTDNKKKTGCVNFVIVLFLYDDRWLVYFEFLVRRRVGVIKIQLLERDIFADKLN